MSYSRRQLYAMGEPLGDSATRHKVGGRIYGGGGSSPATTTTSKGMPAWAEPYAKETLGKASALTDTGQNPYQGYDAPRFAGLSPMQQAAQQQAASMTAAPQLAPATGMTAEAGLRALDTRYDPSQFQGGQFGQQEAQQYMSPYMQSVVDIQQREAQRNEDIAATKRGAQAVGSGAFGGSRQAIMEAEAARNLAQQKGDIQATGSQAAFQQAQAQFNADQMRRMEAAKLAEQSKQYGAGLGLKGLETSLLSAGQLGTLGGQQFQQGMDINRLQAGYGAQQQAMEQQGLSQAYQDFLTQQNYPYKQLGFMSDMLRGLPLGSKSTSEVYEASPSMVEQMAGLGTAALGLSKFMPAGANGGAVTSRPAGLAELALSKMA